MSVQKCPFRFAFFFSLLFSLSFLGCDKLPVPDLDESQGKATEDKSGIQLSAPPQAAQMEQPEPEAKSPEEMLKDFQGLAPREVEDDHLKWISGSEKISESFEELDLAESKISDIGLEQLKGFVNLKSLNLNSSYVRGSGLKSVLGAVHLQELHLDGTQFDVANVPHVQEFQNLKVLSLRNNGLNDSIYEALAKLPQLEELHLDGNSQLLGKNFSQLIKDGQFANLRVLTAGDSQFGFYGALNINKLEKLEELGLGSTQLNLKAMPPISRCVGLKKLDLSGNPLNNESLEELKRSKSLEDLNLNNCKNLGPPAVLTLRTMKNLKRLDVRGTGLRPADIERLQGILKETEIIYAQ